MNPVPLIIREVPEIVAERVWSIILSQSLYDLYCKVVELISL